MIRWLVSLWRGPLCDAGTGLGARPGCLKAAAHTTLVRPAGWSRGFRWCEEHKGEAGRATGIGGRQLVGYWPAGVDSPVKPPPRSPGRPLTDDQVLDADAELAALVAERDDLRRANAAGSEQVGVLRREIARLEEERDAALAQLGEWRESVVAANRISQGFEERALKAEAALAAATMERDSARASLDTMWDGRCAEQARAQAAEAEVERLAAEGSLLRRMVEQVIERPLPAGYPPPLPDAPTEYVLGYLARYVLTGEGDVAEVDRLITRARDWPLLFDEAATTVDLAEMRRAPKTSA